MADTYSWWTVPAQIYRTTPIYLTRSFSTGIDTNLYSTWSVDPTTGVAASIFANVRSQGASSGVGHTIGLLALNTVESSFKLYAYGVEGRVNSTSEDGGSGFDIGVLGLSQWASDAAGGSTRWNIALQGRAEIYQADGSTPRTTGTAIGLYLPATVGGVAKYAILQLGTSDIVRFDGLQQANGGILGPTPTAESITAGATITMSNALSGVKRITSAGAVATVAGAFTAAGVGNKGATVCLINTGSFSITLTAGANNDFSADKILTAGAKMIVCSDGAKWYNMSGVIVP